MPKQIIWSPLSEKDFENILNYLKSNWNQKVAEKFIDITEQLIVEISINPKQYPVINKSRRIRKCVITKHNTLFYRDRKNFIDILRIFDTRQDPIKLLFK